MIVSNDIQVKKDKYSVKNVIEILIVLIVCLIFIAVTYLFSALVINAQLNPLSNSPLHYYYYYVGVLVFALLSSFRLKAVWNGIEIDYEEQTLEFPGGGLSANDILDYIKPSYLLQFFTRKKINLDNLTSMSMESEETKRWNKASSSWTYTYKYFIKFSGTFGAAYVKFNNEGKCSEIYSAIRQVNRMGDPIFRA